MTPGPAMADEAEGVDPVARLPRAPSPCEGLALLRAFVRALAVALLGQFARRAGLLAIGASITAVHAIADAVSIAPFLDDATLYRFGAMRPVGGLRGEAWRLVTSNFLNGTSGHLSRNLSLLIVTCLAGEPAVGSGLVVGTFVLGGILSALLELWAVPVDSLSYGSSGGAMALVGLTAAAILGRPSPAAVGAFLLSLPTVLAERPEVALALGHDAGRPYAARAHVVGLLAGFAIGLLRAVLSWRSSQEPLQRWGWRLFSAALALEAVVVATSHWRATCGGYG